MYLLLHKQTGLINGKWWHGSARLGTADKERGCIGTEEAESLEGESGSKQGWREGRTGQRCPLKSAFSGRNGVCVTKNDSGLLLDFMYLQKYEF